MRPHGIPPVLRQQATGRPHSRNIVIGHRGVNTGHVRKGRITAGAAARRLHRACNDQAYEVRRLQVPSVQVSLEATGAGKVIGSRYDRRELPVAKSMSVWVMVNVYGH
jgi:hypothetical protein